MLYLYGLAEILIEVQGHIVLIFPIFILKGMKNGFLALQQLYPNSYLNGIIDSEFATDDTSIFLDSMNERRYLQFLEHIVAVIVNRTERLNNI